MASSVASAAASAAAAATTATSGAAAAASTAASSSSTGLGGVSMSRRINCGIDALCMQPVDTDFVQQTVRSQHVGLVSFLLPIKVLQDKVHQRYEVETLATDEAGEPYGIFTIVSNVFQPGKQTFMEKLLDRAPFHQIAWKTSVLDRVHWQRTAWNYRTTIQSHTWGKAPKQVFGIDISVHPVHVRAEWDAARNVYSSYSATVPAAGFEMELEDTGVQLLDRDTRIVDGFVDNESALRFLAMHREVMSRGYEGCIYRQPLWSTIVDPNVAKLTKFVPGAELCNFLGLTPEQFPTVPLAAWVLDGVPETHIFTVEGQVEEENDQASSSKFGEKTLHDRVQGKAMGRYHKFKNELREKSYSEIKGEETPR